MSVLSKNSPSRGLSGLEDRLSFQSGHPLGQTVLEYLSNLNIPWDGLFLDIEWPFSPNIPWDGLFLDSTVLPVRTSLVLDYLASII